MSRIFYLHLFHSCIYISIVMCGDGGIMTYASFEGGSVNIGCPHDAQFINNTKYLCRGKCSTINVLADKDIPIETGKTPNDTRFSLNDNKTATTFTITDLKVKDGGQYWCAVRTPLYQLDVYREVFLSIKNVSHMFGVKGDELSVQCHYDHDVINDNKFLCKGEDLSLCETSGVKVSKGKITNGRFSLSDDTSARGFTVTITNLTEEDSGIYWCGNVALRGSQQAHDKWISAVILKVSGESTSHKPTTFSFYITHPASPDSSSRSATSSPSSLLTSSSSSAHSLSPNTDTSLFVFITASVALMLILFGFLLFIYFRRRKKNEQLQLNGVAHGSAGNLKNGEIVQNRVSICYYEEIPLTNVHPGYSLPASGEHDASVYALAQDVPSNDLHYSTIKFTDHPDRTSDGQTSYDYATVVL
ncbi:CMRF35-like molecule 8 [Triplophysa dalaica]|uniref:CMRF35-like molecule 8 n=1 Tax=Triplophysa dalaica TaxID=1582913 RepID=UPI0024DFA521|nr:CMRF35-like molecule 8 [Triplophysa dalaica]